MNNKFDKIDKSTISAAKRGDTAALMANLSEEDRNKVQSALNNKEKLKSILNTEAAQQLIKILGGKNNG